MMTSIHIIWGREPVSRYKLGIIDNMVRLAHAAYEFQSQDHANAFLYGVREAKNSEEWVVANTPLDLRKLGMPLRGRLIEAARRGDIESVKSLVESGLKIDAVDSQGLNALHHAAKTGHGDIAHVLIDAGADVNLPAANFDAKTPMHLACESSATGTAAVVNVLAENGADVNKRDGYGNSPLHSLMAGDDNKPGSVDLKAKILLKEGADPRNENMKQERPDNVIGAALGASSAILELISHMSAQSEAGLDKKDAMRLQAMRQNAQAGPSPMPGRLL